MNLKKYLSKQVILRICLLLAMVSGAMVFDMVHTSGLKLSVKNRKIPLQEENGTAKTFICNQLPSYNLRISISEIPVRNQFACSQDKYLIRYYNLRTFQLMKAEAVHSCFPSVSSFHSLPFNRVLYASPDDKPPLS